MVKVPIVNPCLGWYTYIVSIFLYVVNPLLTFCQKVSSCARTDNIDNKKNKMSNRFIPNNFQSAKIHKITKTPIIHSVKRVFLRVQKSDSMTETFSIWEVLFLLCFAVSWPVSIAKSLRTKVVIGKSPLFMSLVILGYIFGIIHKVLYSRDVVIFLYMFNALLVSTDLFLYFLYIGKNRKELQQGNME